MKLINKLTLGHLIVGMFVIAVALVGMGTINNIDFTFNEISEQTLPVIEALEDVRAAGLKIGSSTSEFVFLRAEGKSDLTGLYIEKENIILARQRYDSAIARYEELVNKFFPDEKGLAGNVNNSGKKLQNASNELIALKEQGASGSIVLEKWEEFETAEQEFLKTIDGAIAHESEEIALRKQNVDRAIAASVKTILVAGLLTFAIAVVLGARISKSIIDPVTKLKNAAVDFGKGKLDTRVDIKSGDEVGILAACFNQMAERLEQSIGERKKVEEVLRESEERYRRLVDMSPYGIAIHSEGKFVFVNRAGAKILGAANPEELIGIPVLQIIHPDYRELVKERIRMQEEGKTAPLIEEKLLRLDGTSVDVELTSIPFTYKGKQAMYGVFMDITERKRAEEKLRESEKRFRAAFDFSGAGMAIVSTDGHWLRVNQNLCKIVGYSEDELLKTTFQAITHQDDLPKNIEAQKQLLAGKLQYLQTEKRYRHRDGHYVWVLMTTSLVRSEQGKPLYFVTQVVDINERKRAEEKMRQSEAKYRTLTESLNELIYSADPKTLATTYINSAVEEIYSYSVEEWLKDTELWVNTIYPGDKERVLAEFTEAQRKTESKAVEYRIVRKDGTKRWVENHFTWEKDPLGKVVSLNGVVYDITEHKKAEEIRLENERLAYANQAKSEFLAVMSHELRTPLNAVIGFSELLKQGNAGELNEKQEHFVDNVLVSGKRLHDLINNILDIARIEAGKMELVVEKISVPEVINEAVVFMNENAAKRNVVLKKDFDPRLDIIEADRTKFRQILNNLLDNAVKFSKPEGGTVTITTKKSEDMAKISVSDTGIGIKEKDIGKLFTMFLQLDSGISRNHGGTGLGLAITKQLVELHGGKITVESKYGEGSTFTFLIPLVAKKGGENK